MWVLKLAMSIRTDGLQDINNNNTRWTRTKMASTTMMTEERKKNLMNKSRKSTTESENAILNVRICVLVISCRGQYNFLFYVGSNNFWIPIENERKITEFIAYDTGFLCHALISHHTNIYWIPGAANSFMHLSSHLSNVYRMDGIILSMWIRFFVFLFYFDLIVHIRRKRTRSPFCKCSTFLLTHFPRVCCFFSLLPLTIW